MVIEAYFLDDSTLVSITIIRPRKFGARYPRLEPCLVKLWSRSLGGIMTALMGIPRFCKWCRKRETFLSVDTSAALTAGAPPVVENKVAVTCRVNRGIDVQTHRV